MSYLLPYRSRSDLDDLMEMVALRCEQFMRCGGLVENSRDRTGWAVDPETMAEIIRRVTAGEPMKAIAQDVGLHYRTVVRITRHVRGVGASR